MSDVEHQNDDEINIGELVSYILSHKYKIIIVTALFSVFSVIYAIMAKPIYTGNALIHVEAKSSGFAGLTGLADAFGGGGEASAATATELEIIKSRSILEPTIKKFNLNILIEQNTFPIIGDYFYRKYAKNPEFSDVPLGGMLSFVKQYSWGGQSVNVVSFEVAPEYIDETFSIVILGENKFSLYYDYHEVLQGELGKRVTSRNGKIVIQIDGLKGNIGQKFFITKLDDVLIYEDLKKRISASEQGKQSGIISVSLNDENKDTIVNVIDDVLETYEANSAQKNSDTAGRSLNFMKDKLPLTSADLARAEEEIYKYRLDNKTVDLTLQTQQILNQLLKLDENINLLNLEEPELARKFNKNHPIYSEFLRKKQDLVDKRNALNIQTGQIPTEQFNLFRLQRNLELSQKIHLQTLNKYEELQIIKAGAIGSFSIIDNARVHPKPIAPKKAVIAVVGTMIGFILIVGYLLIQKMLMSQIESSDILEAAGFNVVANIQENDLEKKYSKSLKNSSQLNLISHSHPLEKTVEGLRGLRTNLHFSMMDAANNLMMITSPSPQVGKSFVISNLAYLVAQAGQKTLLVDLDMRRGHLHERFGVKNEVGIANHLAGNVGIDDVLISTKIDNLDLITSGDVTQNPSDLLSGTEFKNFCRHVSKNYDCVLIDTPPLLAVADANIIAQEMGLSLMVVRENVSEMKQVSLATTQLDKVGVSVSGYIYNGMSKNGKNSQYQYDYT